MTVETWDFDTFPPLDVEWKLKGVTNSGDTSVSGFNRVGRTDGGGFWTCRMSGISLYTRAQILAARALEARLDGGVTQINVPGLEVAFAPYPGFVIPPNPLHPSGGGFVSATVAADAVLRATTLSIQISGGEPLVGGERFTIDDTNGSHRLYTVASAGTPDGSGVQVCSIRPPLRNAVANGTGMDFNSPSCQMRLTNADAFMDALHQSRLSNLTAEFVEDFDAPA